MKRLIRISSFPAVLAAVVCLLCLTVFAADPEPPDSAGLCALFGADTAVYPQPLSDEMLLCLPSAADLRQLTLRFGGESAELHTESGSILIRSGEPFDLLSLFPDGLPEDGGRAVLSAEEESVQLRIFRSEGLCALFLRSDKPEEDRFWVEQDKEHKAEGSMTLLRPDGTAVCDGAVKSIKGRGNSTWHYPKKPYQIKLEKKADLLETGIASEAAKTWVLLANYCDPTLLHNTISFHIASELGLPFIPHSRPVELYYDGVYRGLYLLCEKTEVGEGRVDIPDLDALFESCNPDIADFDRLAEAQGYDEAGNLYQYVGGLMTPPDISGGYLLEIDYRSRAVTEKSWFSTEHDTYVVLKSPEYASADAVTYIGTLFRQFENAVYNGGIDPESGKRYDELMDVDSLVRVYLLAELSMDPDSFRSSCYFYKPADSEKLYAGPVWDFDSAYGSSVIVFPVDGAAAAAQHPLVLRLLSLPDFREKTAACMEELIPILDALLSDDGAETLDGYAAELASARTQNDLLWPEAAPEDAAAETDALRALLDRRIRWLERFLLTQETSLLAAVFLDVRPGSWYFDDVVFTVERGIFNGTSYGKFSPAMTLTRGMAVTLLYRLAGQPAASDAESVFSDVTVGAWYHDAVLWAAESGIASGYPDGCFHPDAPVTRQEFVSLLCRLAGDPAAEGDLSAFADADSVAEYARGAVNWAVQTGLLRGDHSALRPESPVTRAQAAALLHRYLTAAPDAA